MKKRVISIFIATAVSALLLHVFLMVQREHRASEKHLRQLLALQTLMVVSDDIQFKVNGSARYADFLDVIISQDPLIAERTIGRYAELILEQGKNIASVQLAPDCVVTMSYPLKGNEAAIGHDLMADPERRDFILEGIRKRQAVLQGPVEAKQGGYLLFNRTPIFITQDGEERLWGLSIIALDFTGLIAPHEERLAREHYRFALRSASAGRPPQLLWGDGDIFAMDAIKKTISLPDTEWELAIYPVAGWCGDINTWNSNVLFSLLSMLVFFLTYWSVSFFQQKVEESRKEHLTETLNKNTFTASVSRRLALGGGPHAVILIDLDDFKQINDNFGHPVGDLVLVETARRLHTVLRKTDLLSRFGGDEYLAFLSPVPDEHSVYEIMRRMAEQVSRPMRVGDMDLCIHISVGHAIAPRDGNSFNALYRVADANMYLQKGQKKPSAESPA